MFRYLWQDLRMVYGDHEKRIWRVPGLLAVFSAFPWLGVSVSDTEKTGSQLMIYLWMLVVLLPVLINMIAWTGHPLHLPKLMYLCPLNAAERKEYLKRKYWYRVGIHMVPAIVAVPVMLNFLYCDLWTASLYLFSLFFGNMLVMPDDLSENNGEYWLCYFQVLTNTISEIVILGIIGDEYPDTAVKIVLSVVLLCIQLPAAVVSGRRVRKRIELKAKEG